MHWRLTIGGGVAILAACLVLLPGVARRFKVRKLAVAPRTERRAKEYLAEALQFLLADGRCSEQFGIVKFNR